MGTVRFVGFAGLQLSVLKRLSFILNTNVNMAALHSFIKSHLQYYPLVWAKQSKGETSSLENGKGGVWDLFTKRVLEHVNHWKILRQQFWLGQLTYIHFTLHFSMFIICWFNLFLNLILLYYYCCFNLFLNLFYCYYRDNSTQWANTFCL